MCWGWRNRTSRENGKWKWGVVEREGLGLFAAGIVRVKEGERARRRGEGNGVFSLRRLPLRSEK